MPAPAIRSRVLSLLALCLVFTTDFGAQSPRANPDLTVHEWGTFTSIAGRDGLAMKWSTLRGSADLPSFVEHLNGAQFKAAHGNSRPIFLLATRNHGIGEGEVFQGSNHGVVSASQPRRA